MAEIITYDLRVINGGALYLPPWEEGNTKWTNFSTPDIYASTDIQHYPTGTIYRHGFRTFVYTRLDPTYIGSGGTQAIIGGYLVESCSEQKNLSNSGISGAIGANTTVVNMGGSVAKDAYAGGFMGIQKAVLLATTVGGIQTFQIISNTASDASNYVTFTLDGNLVVETLANTDFTISENPYALVRCTPVGGPYGMTMGVLLQTTAANRYIWVQTGGPCNMVHAGSTFEGEEPYSVPVHAFSGNANMVVDASTAELAGTTLVSSTQLIGYSYASTDIGGPGGVPADITIAMYVWLTIFN